MVLLSGLTKGRHRIGTKVQNLSSVDGLDFGFVGKLPHHREEGTPRGGRSRKGLTRGRITERVSGSSEKTGTGPTTFSYLLYFTPKPGRKKWRVRS